ncbi:MAG TPA: aldose epimerase family protein [Steroidobacteraceae bacterium]|nr:aldose epimerase family protein [Steroidobacteraceae bacterium]
MKNGTIRSFGRLPDGQEVAVHTLGSEDGLQAEVLTLGGTLRSLSLPVRGKRIPLLLSLPDLPAYLKDTSYLGQLVGRYGNRIAGAAFELDGKQYKLTANNGPNTLHGGDVGFGKYVWKVLGSGGGKNTYVKLGHHSPAGINGFPGNLDITALISVYENTLTLAYEATTDAPTPISFTWHPYFNISGDPGRSIDEQLLMMNASHYLPINENRVPTGEIAPVAGTPFDFRKPRSVRVPPPASHPQIALTQGFDHCWALDPSSSSGAAIAGELHSPASGVRMRVKTNLPGLQVYGAYHLKTAYPGWHAICLEPENFPDAPNHANFPSSILRPGETHKSFMSFTFL